MSDTFCSGDLVKWVAERAVYTVYIYLCRCEPDSAFAYVITPNGQIDWFFVCDLKHVEQ